MTDAEQGAIQKKLDELPEELTAMQFVETMDVLTKAGFSTAQLRFAFDGMLPCVPTTESIPMITIGTRGGSTAHGVHIQREITLDYIDWLNE